MELGNIIYSNSRRRYRVDRSWEGTIGALFVALDCSNSGIEYENDMFTMHPYWWGDCTCGWGEELRRLFQKYGWRTDGDDWWHGCALRCTCDYNDRYEETMQDYAEQFGHNGHKDDCKLVIPNFLYKPTGYELQWYKYALRDSYANANIKYDYFREIILNCVASVLEDV